MIPAATARDWGGLLVLTAFWGSAFLLTNVALGALAPALLVAARVTIAAAVLLTVVAVRRVPLPRPGRAWVPLLVMAVLGTVLPFHLIAWAQQYIDSAQAGVLMAVMPLFVLTLAHFFVPGSRLTPCRGVGFALGFVGVCLIIGPPDTVTVAGGNAFLGSLAVLGAALSYAVNTIYARRLPAEEPLALAAGTMLAAAVVAAPAALLSDAAPPAAPGLAAFAAVTALGVLATGLATVIYLRIVQGPGPAFLSLVNYLVPGWAVVAGAIVLGEALSGAAVAGLALLLCGVAVSEFGARAVAHLRTRLQPRAPGPGARHRAL